MLLCQINRECSTLHSFIRVYQRKGIMDICLRIVKKTFIDLMVTDLLVRSKSLTHVHIVREKSQDLRQNLITFTPINNHTIQKNTNTHYDNNR